MSSTTMPRVMLVTTDNDSPTSPTARPQIPKPIAPGTRFGTRLASPNRHERRATMSTREIPTSATVVPRSIARMLRRPSQANIRLVPASSARTMPPATPGAFSASHCCARRSRASSSFDDSVSVATVIRVADLSTSSWLFRSSP